MAIYDVKVNQLDGTPASLGDYKGKALLIVNVASKCGLTPQYEGLEKLHETLGGRGFEVLGFPCNQFMEQEPGTAEEIQEFCSIDLRRGLPAVREDRGQRRRTSTRCTQQLNATPDAEGYTGDIRWNFEKFLVSPEGEVVGRFNPTVEPQDPALVAAIEAQLPS